jgi:hypothetical protein
MNEAPALDRPTFVQSLLKRVEEDGGRLRR